MIAYGPVPSRRLGRSLGINNIPSKHCTYACRYCQVGPTTEMPKARRAFYDPDVLVRQVRERVAEVRAAGEAIDWLAFVPDGEPTLDINLGAEIAALRELELPVAVICNATLIAHGDVRRELATADWVSLKVDTVDEATWRRLNRPRRSAGLQAMLDGMLQFRDAFEGTLVSETMLVDGLNDTAGHAEATADFLARLRPSTAYLSVPTRPTVGEGVRPASAEAVVRCHEIFGARLDAVECLLGYEGNSFTTAGDPRRNLLDITAVHPMRREAVEKLLEKSGAAWSLVEELVAAGELLRIERAGHIYFLRRPRGA